jgi:hypothetical protein
MNIFLVYYTINSENKEFTHYNTQNDRTYKGAHAPLYVEKITIDSDSVYAASFAAFKIKQSEGINISVFKVEKIQPNY